MKRDWTGNYKSIYATLGASNHTDKEREENDFYATDSIAIDKLINSGIKLKSPIWECACGQGDLSKRLEELGYEVFSTDLINRGYGETGIDFLEQTDKWNGTILTNPPYIKAYEFIEHAMSIATEGNEIWMFLKLTFLESKKRRKLFEQYPPVCVHVFSERILCAKNGDFTGMKAGGGSAVAYAWYQFKKGYKGETIIKWLQ